MKNKGFTLIELLLVIGIIAILMTLVIVAVNPIRQLAQARNIQRWSHVNSILSATYQNIVDHGGTFSCAAGILPTSATIMGTGTGKYDTCACLVSTYLAAMPYDPSSGSYTDCTDYNSGYTIMQNSTTNRITVAAPSAEISTLISVTR